MNDHILPHDFGQALVNYLQRQPWQEVNAFIVTLQRLDPCECKPAEETPPAPTPPAVVPDEDSG